MGVTLLDDGRTAEDAPGGAVLLSGFSYLIASQVSSRAVTFVLNLVITRMLSPEAYGLAAVQFHLINTVILFLAREGFRRGCLRPPSDGISGVHRTRRTLATAAWCVPAGLVVTAITCRVAVGWSAAGGDTAAHRTAVAVQGGAAMVELLSEPLYILAVVQLRFRLRAAIDTAAITAKAFATVLLLRLTGLPAALALSYGQVAFAAVTLACYAAAYAPDVPSWLESGADANEVTCNSGRVQSEPTADVGAGEAAGGPIEADGRKSDLGACSTSPGAGPEEAHSELRRRPQAPGFKAQLQGGRAAADDARRSTPLLHLPTLRLCGSFSLQAAEKLVLAEGSKMVVVTQPSAAQGVYGLVANLGGLVVRTAFQPFEEAAFTAFSTNPGRRGHAQLLTALVRGVSIVGLVAAAFGPAYSWLLLRLLYSTRWADTGAPAALGAYAGYIVLLAVNGILEAFVHAAADSRQLVRINMVLLAFAAAHMALSIALVGPGGALGLIAADCVNMAMRIAFSLTYTRQLFADVPSFSSAVFLPSAPVLGALAVAFLVTGASTAACLGPAAGGPVQALLAMGTLGRRDGGASLHLLSRRGLDVQAAAHILVGCSCLGGVLMVARWAERPLWSQLAALRRRS